MNNIVVKNGIILTKTDNYILYEMYTEDTTKYYMCLPINNQKKYQMIIDFPEEYYKSLLNEDIITEIKRICDVVFKSNPNSIYVLPNITTYDLTEAENENDDHAYKNFLKKLQKYTYNVFLSLSKNNDININNTIGIITQTVDDKKFMNYLETTMPGFFESINLSSLTREEDINNDTGWTTLGGPSEGEISKDTANKKSNHKVKVLIPNKHGFLNITFIIVIIALSLIFGISIAMILIK